MDREELVQQILKQVLAKLTDMGEKADAACVRPDAVCPAAHKPGLLILTQEHGVDCHAKLEDPRLQERYGTQCALMADYAVDIADVEVVILYQLSIEALCKLSSGLCDTPYTRLAQRAILSGKRIYVPTQEVELLQNNTMPAAYRAMLQKKLELLEACGLRICPQQTLVDAILHGGCAAASVDAPCACPAPAAGQAVRLEKRVVTERDILTMSAQKASALHVGARCILTALALECAKAKGISVVRDA